MISIMAVSRNESALGQIRKYISEDSEMELVYETAGGEDAPEKVENLEPDVMLIYSDRTDRDGISLAERITLKRPRTFVILLLDEMTVENLQKANAAGCHNIMAMPENSGELIDAVHRVYQTESGRIEALNSNERVTWNSKVITVYGAKGGVGKTTIATNLAVKLAERNRKVAILDLDLQFGDVHVFMDIDPKDTISDLMQDTQTDSIDSVRSYMNIHPSGVHVLAAPKSPEYAELVSAERVQSLLGLLRANYDYVIIDTTSNFTDATVAAMEASSTILLITGLDVSILKNSKVAMNLLESLGQKSKVRAIINRAVEINSITIADVQRIVDAPILSRIPSDYMTAVAALNQGKPFVQSVPKAKLSMAVSDVAAKIDTGSDNFDIQQLTPKERRALLKKYKTKDKSEKRSILGFGR